MPSAVRSAAIEDASASARASPVRTPTVSVKAPDAPVRVLLQR